MNDEKEKKCLKCNNYFPIDSFRARKNPKGIRYTGNICRVCEQLLQNQRRKERRKKYGSQLAGKDEERTRVKYE